MSNLFTMCNFLNAVFNAIEQVFSNSNMMGCKYSMAFAMKSHKRDFGIKFSTTETWSLTKFPNT